MKKIDSHLTYNIKQIDFLFYNLKIKKIKKSNVVSQKKIQSNNRYTNDDALNLPVKHCDQNQVFQIPQFRNITL